MKQRQRGVPAGTVSAEAAPAGTVSAEAAPAGTVSAPPARARAATRRGAARTIGTRLRIVVGAACMLVGLTGLAAPMMSGPVHAEDAGSAVTVHGTGEFADLTITVGQTRDLVDQRIHVSWTGAKPTLFKGSDFAADFLQVMQCWGDPVKGPDRTQCQFGVLNDNRNASLVPDTRRLDGQYAPVTPDPIKADNVPFLGADGTVATVYNVPAGAPDSTTSFTQLFDRQSTNEVAYVQSASDGTGQLDFETESAQEAPHLGCGNASMVDAQGRPYACFLVIVPRGSTEIDGKPFDKFPDHPEKELVSSPLAASNWANHITVPLTFQPQTDACPPGQKTYAIAGSEQMAEAMRLWAPQACHVTGADYNLIRLSDDQARSVLTAPDPGLSFVGRALSAGDTPPGAPVVYAPVALSGLTISYELDQFADFNADPSVRVHDGTPLTGMKLTPKLVAKLLTQSYQNGVSVHAPEMQTGGVMADNPVDLTFDPEFQALNPQFKGLTFSLWISDSVITPTSGADAVAELWSWINRDKDARAFLDGVRDKGADGKPGMVVNPAYKGIALPISQFPKQDPYCYVPSPDTKPPSPELCAPDQHPWAPSMLAAARGIARGNNLAKINWNATSNPPGWEGNLQNTGQHSLMGVVDTASAQRFGLQTALLQNASGAFVAPDEAGLTAATTDMTTVDSIPLPDQRSKNPAAYPLAHLTYAATVPSRLTKEEGAAYADFLFYAVSAGQVPGASVGKLAPGYVTLPPSLGHAANVAIDAIRAQAGTGVPGPAGSSTGGASASGPGQVINIVIPGSTGSRATGTSGTGSSEPAGGSAGGAPGGNPPGTPAGTGPAQATGGVITPKPKPSSTPVPPSLTPANKLGAVRMTLLVLLVAGGALILAGPALRSWATKIPRRAIPSGVHLE
ncbi:hypothetical protein [Catenulispora subtropica]|uniref:PBP domain-containing protein n=1 Tax=Catenulispora subtropica TaxID=450798 RepID=A0ABP5BN23_9ACTN